MNKYKCFDKNDPNYWVERIRIGDKFDELEFIQTFNEFENQRDCSECHNLSVAKSGIKRIKENTDSLSENSDIEECRGIINNIDIIVKEDLIEVWYDE